jgi:hypothetical protein
MAASSEQIQEKQERYENSNTEPVEMDIPFTLNMESCGFLFSTPSPFLWTGFFKVKSLIMKYHELTMLEQCNLNFVYSLNTFPFYFSSRKRTDVYAQI